MPEPFSSRTSKTLDPMLVLAEVEHRIADEFTLAISSINLIARTCEGDARRALNSAAARLRDYARAHRALLPPIAEDALDLSAYLREVCRALACASLADREVTLILNEAPPITIEAWRGWRVGLILSELISNSLRHGTRPMGGGAIRVELTADDNIQCRVIDNGKGSKISSVGNGTHILNGLVAELCGHVHRKFFDQGAMVLVTLPRFHPDTPDLHGAVG